MSKPYFWPVLLIAVLLVPISGSAREPSNFPVLRVETGAHTANVTGLAIAGDGQTMASASFDKTVRIWSLEHPGLPPRTIRVPIAEDREGALYAVALSPDGRIAVTGGWTGGWDGGAPWSLYVLDTASGAMVDRVGSLPGRMVSLAYSRDGSRLAVGLKSKPGVLLLDTKRWSVVARDDQFSDDIPSVDMDAGGRVVAVSLSGEIAVLEPGLRQKRMVRAPDGDEPAIARFSPDGTIIAVGYGNSPRVDLFSADDLHLIASADSGGIDKGFIALAWSTDGEYLYGGGYSDRGGRNLIRRWSAGGRGGPRDFPAALGTITRLQSLTGGRLALTTSTGIVAVLDSSMRIAWERRPGIADFRDQSDTLRASADGGIVEFAYDRFGSSPLRFSLATKSLSLGNPDDPQLAAALTEVPELTIHDWKHSEHPSLNGVLLPLRAHEESLSVAVAPDHRSIVLGTQWRIMRLDASGNALWAVDAPGGTWAVVATENRKLVIAAFSDGTIRWLNMADGKVLLTLFSHAPTHHWVAWTQSGYYAASPEGDTLVGWHVNRGKDHAADFFPVNHFRDIYYRPDVVEKVLGGLDEAGALRRGDLEQRHTDERPRKIAELLPPVVMAKILSDAPLDTPKVRVSYEIRRSTADPIKAVEVRADGRPIASIVADGRPLQEAGQLELYVPRRDTALQIIAQSASGIWSEPAALHLRWEGPVEGTKPSLFVLAIGIADYAIPELRLKLAAKDAVDFRRVFDGQSGKAYRNVEVRALTNEQATGENLRRGLDWLASSPTSRDVAILFMAGHGVDDIDGQYFFIPQEVGPDEATNRGIAYREIREALERVAGRVLLFIDTCHSGAAGASSTGAAADMSRIVNDLKSPEYGIATFASSTGRQLSYESPTWGNGAFTKAVVEALSGKADFLGNGYVTTSELEAYVSDRVMKLTRGRQTPASGRPLSTDAVLVLLR